MSHSAPALTTVLRAIFPTYSVKFSQRGYNAATPLTLNIHQTLKTTAMDHYPRIIGRHRQFNVHSRFPVDPSAGVQTVRESLVGIALESGSETSREYRLSPFASAHSSYARTLEMSNSVENVIKRSSITVISLEAQVQWLKVKHKSVQVLCFIFKQHASSVSHVLTIFHQDSRFFLRSRRPKLAQWRGSREVHAKDSLSGASR